MSERIGLLGGTFNPVHNGHLFLALEAMHQAGLERVVFIPNRLPPHKEPPRVTAAARLAMLEAAVRDVPRFSVSRVELDRDGPSFTIDTLEAVGGDRELVFICGADAFTAPWHRLEEVVGKLHLLLIANRWGVEFSIPAQLRRLPAELQKKIRLMNFPDIAISSSDLRHRITHRRPFRFLIPESVYRIITESKLYDDQREATNS